MKSLSTEQFNKAKKYEHQFQTAVYSRYLRAQPTSYYSELSELCNELKIRLNLSCPACVLNAITQIGRMYFETKDEMLRETEKPADAEQSDKSDSSISSDSSNNIIKTVSKTVKVTSKSAKSKSNKSNNKTKKN